MSRFAVIADSTSDLDKEIREKYEIDYVRMNYVVDGAEYDASLDWENHGSHEFYDMMRGGKRILTTQVPREEFINKFRSYLEKGEDVLYIACSSALSGSVNLAVIIAKELEAEFPGRKVVCIDSLCSSLGQGYMLIRASMMRAEGKSLDDVASYIEKNKLCFNQFGTTDDLKYLKRAGRVKASSAFFGNMFGIKPIIISDKTGQNLAVEKVKGAANAKRRIAEKMAEIVDENDKDTLLISHADCLEDAHKLRDEILKLISFKNVIIGTIGPIVGSCVGPGTIISFCYGKEVTIGGNE
ncbi:MAG: DegV family protein [Clostridia bacterium]|nr:DegV family protein [Clostridia bacterium]